MRWKLIGLTALGAVTVTPATAQVLNLTGPFQCVQNCLGVGTPIVTQNGWDLNLVNEVGMPSRAWVDWPGHIWARNWNMGAIYSPDGMMIQFDNGSVWRRVVPVVLPSMLRSRG